MKLSESIRPELIHFDFLSHSKKETIEKVAALIEQNGCLNDLQQYKADVFAREALSTTGIGMSIAIPHARSAGVKETCFTLVKLRRGVEWASLDDQPVKYVIMLAVPENANSEFLKLLSELSMNLMDDEFRTRLLTSNTKEGIIALFKEKEEEQACIS